MQGRVAQAQLTSSLLTGLANPVCLHPRAKNKRGHWRYILTVSSKSAQSAIRRCTRVPNMWCALFPFSLHSVRFGECIEASACLHHVMLSLALGSHMNLCLCFFQAGNVAWARMLRHPNRRPGFVLSVGLSRAGAVGHVPRLTRQVAGQHSSRSGRLPSNLELAGLSRIASCSASVTLYGSRRGPLSYRSCRGEAPRSLPQVADFPSWPISPWAQQIRCCRTDVSISCFRSVRSSPLAVTS